MSIDPSAEKSEGRNATTRAAAPHPLRGALALAVAALLAFATGACESGPAKGSDAGADPVDAGDLDQDAVADVDPDAGDDSSTVDVRDTDMDSVAPDTPADTGAADTALHDIGDTEVETGPGDTGPPDATVDPVEGADIEELDDASDAPDAICGDGLWAVDSEACDDGNVEGGDRCNPDCTLPRCGDGYVHYGEECDDGNTASDDGCSRTCVLEFCGDGIVNSDAEECDDGNPFPHDGCTASCVVEFCGDGVLNVVAETCDDGNNEGGDGCTPTCVRECEFATGSESWGCVPYCGNGRRHVTEQCDDGNTEDYDGCSATCTIECGDHVVQPRETCDDGNRMAGDGCDDQCQTERCGDGVLAAGETCDDGNDASYDGCSAECLLEWCGDTVTQPDEECDDGNHRVGDGCDPDCRLETCGDGAVGDGEVCDDGNYRDGDGCSAACEIELCGDGVVDEGETCDDDGIVPYDGCGPDCQIEECGAHSPPPRVGAAAVYAESLGVIIEFGGALEFGEMLSFADGSISTGTHVSDGLYLRERGPDGWRWAPIVATGTPPEPRVGHVAVWDDEQRQMLVFGGRRRLGTHVPTTLHVLDWNYGLWRWLEPEVDGVLVTRTDPAAVWDAVGRRMIVVGGLDGTEVPQVVQRRGDGWTVRNLDVVGWVPQSRTGTYAVWDAEGSRVIVGPGDPGEHEHEILSLTETSGTWRWTTVGSVWGTDRSEPGCGYAYAAAAWDADGNRLLAVGGASYWSNFTNALCGFGRTPRFAPSDGEFLRRYRHAAFWMPAEQELVVTGIGSRGSEVHTFVEMDGEWRVTNTAVPRSVPLQAHGAAVAWVPEHRAFYVVGGFDYSSDLEVFRLRADPVPRWERVVVGGDVPLSRRGHQLHWDAERQRLLVVAGFVPCFWFECPPPSPLVGAIDLSGPTAEWRDLVPSYLDVGEQMITPSEWDGTRRQLVGLGGSEPFVVVEGVDAWERRSVAFEGDISAGYGAIVRRGTDDEYIVFRYPSNTGRAVAATLSLVDGIWVGVPIVPSGEPPPYLGGFSAAWDDARGELLVFGGQLRYGTPVATLYGLRQEADGWVWREIDAGPGPSPRVEHAAAWDAEGDRMLIFGGRDGTVPNNETWFLERTGGDRWTRCQ